MRKLDLVVDVANMVYKAHHRFNIKQQPPMMSGTKLTGHVHGTMSMLLSFHRQYSTGRNVRFVFVKEGNCKWRRELLAAYKANRGGQPNPNGTGILEEAWSFIEMLPGLSVVAEGQEADDAIAAHVVGNPDRQHVILSADRDLWQLIGRSHVSVVTSTKEKPVTVYEIETDFGTTRPELLPLAKACLGDTSDNIPGVMRFSRDDLKILLNRQPPSLGQTSEQIAQSFLDTASHAPGLKPRTVELIKQSLEQIARSHKIATLQTKCPLTSTTNRADAEGLKQRLEAWECFSTAERIGEIFMGAK
jgi:5'-3' exonuclease